MKNKLVIVDYGVGNLRSVDKAFEFIGCKGVVSSSADDIRNASAIVLPGVGAFDDAVKHLNSYGLYGVLKDMILNGVPFLGICLGMQLLFEYSQEQSSGFALMNRGFGIIKGYVRQFEKDSGLKIPHMGWNSLTHNGEGLFAGIRQQVHTYFVHSFYVSPEDESVVSAYSDYGVKFAAAVKIRNISATQFHPEKSGVAGLSILRNFVREGGLI